MLRTADALDTLDDCLGCSFEDGLLEVAGVELEVYLYHHSPSCATTLLGKTSFADERSALRLEGNILVVQRHEQQAGLLALIGDVDSTHLLNVRIATVEFCSDLSGSRRTALPLDGLDELLPHFLPRHRCDPP